MKINCVPWQGTQIPSRVLIIRFHALGDIMITLPYLASLKKNLPGTSLYLLTRKEFADIPKNLYLFEKVITLNDSRNGKLQLVMSLLKLPRLLSMRFDIVIDLQNNFSSRFVRKSIFPKAWSEFDKSSKISAADRARFCIDAVDLTKTRIETVLSQRNSETIGRLLSKNNLENKKFVILNPCGAFSSRNWPLERYIEFAGHWSSQFPTDQFLVLGIASMKLKARFLKEGLGDKLTDLCGLTTQSEAFALIKHAKFNLTEDGGLMHMAWVQAVPTLALFGSTPGYWSAPQGEWSLCLNSSDLECGNCFLAQCKFTDNRCLTRYSAKMVFEKSLQLLSTVNS